MDPKEDTKELQRKFPSMKNSLRHLNTKSIVDIAKVSG